MPGGTQYDADNVLKEFWKPVTKLKSLKARYYLVCAHLMIQRTAQAEGLSGERTDSHDDLW